MVARLQKVISQWGIASRRQAEAMILAGRVRVNGQVVSLGTQVDVERDAIEIDGRPLNDRPQLTYLLINKPLGIISTCRDDKGRSTVLDLIPPAIRPGLYPVGRLDADSTGALILTNDGQFTFTLTHPRHQVPKTYLVWLAGHPQESTLAKWRRGLMLDGRITQPATISVQTRNAQNTLVEIILKEGRNRQIRRIAEQIGHPVLKLHRTAIGTIHLGSLNSGRYRPLTSPELDWLKQQLLS